MRCKMLSEQENSRRVEAEQVRAYIASASSDRRLQSQLRNLHLENWILK